MVESPSLLMLLYRYWILESAISLGNLLILICIIKWYTLKSKALVKYVFFADTIGCLPYHLNTEYLNRDVSEQHIMENNEYFCFPCISVVMKTTQITFESYS